MADKKVTELTELSSASQDDLLLIIDNPAGTPLAKKITAGNLFGGISFVTANTTGPQAAFRATITANAAPSTGNTVIAGVFIANALATAVNTTHQFGISVTSMLGQSAAVVSNTLAAALLTLDVSNAAALPSNTYGAIISVANTGARAVQPTAFLKLMDNLTGSNALSTKYLLSANVSTVLANTVTSIGAVSGKLAVQINGTDYWIPLCTAGGNA